MEKEIPAVVPDFKLRPAPNLKQLMDNLMLKEWRGL